MESEQTKKTVRYLNIPAGLNPVEQEVVNEFPDEGMKVGIVVGAGDGRLAAALKEKMGAGGKVFVIEQREVMRKLLHGWDNVGVHAWDFYYYEKIKNECGGIDFIVFENIHEYWDGKVNTMRRIMQLVKPTGWVWVNFYNSTTLYEVGRHLPPLETGFERLGNPMEQWARVDVTSWMLYFSSFDVTIHTVWGMLEDHAYEYCQQAEKEPTKWRVKGCEVDVQDIGDAFVLGAPVISMKLGVGREAEPETKFLGLEYNGAMMQSVLFPYADIIGEELDTFETYAEVLRYMTEEEHEDSALIEFFVNQVKDMGEIKKVLVLGAGWGQDLAVLKKHAGDWEVTGVDRSADKVAMGKKIAEDSGVKLVYSSEEDDLPFGDGEFDLVVSLRHFSSIYHGFGKHLAEEAMRVAKVGVALFEDSRGPELSMRLKSYDIPGMFEQMGNAGEVLPLNINEQETGLYILKVGKSQGEA